MPTTVVVPLKADFGRDFKDLETLINYVCQNIDTVREIMCL